MEKRKLPDWAKQPPAQCGILAMMVSIPLGLLSALLRLWPWPAACAFLLASLYMSLRFQFIDKFFRLDSGGLRPRQGGVPLYLLSWLLILMGLIVFALIKKSLAIAFGVGICLSEVVLLFLAAALYWRALTQNEGRNMGKCE
jgi:hypothetical protein